MISAARAGKSVVQARHAKALAEQQARVAEEAKQKLAAAARRMQVPPISTASTASGGVPYLALPPRALQMPSLMQHMV